MTKTRTFSIHCFDRANGNYFHTSCIYLRAPSIRPLWVVRSYVVCRFPELVSLHVYRGWLLCYCWRGCSALCNIDIAKKSSFVIHSFACLLTTNAMLWKPIFALVLCRFAALPSPIFWSSQGVLSSRAVSNCSVPPPLIYFSP